MLFRRLVGHGTLFMLKVKGDSMAGRRSPTVQIHRVQTAQMARAAMRGKITALQEAFTGYFIGDQAFAAGEVAGASPCARRRHRRDL